MVEFRFTENEMMPVYATMTLSTREWVLFPTYLGRGIASIRKGMVSLDIDTD